MSLVSRLDGGTNNPVKIAVLDTGYDAQDPFIDSNCDRIKGHHCLIQGSKTNEDQQGHGTHITALLLELAPFAEIYVAKVSATGAKDREFAYRIKEVALSTPNAGLHILTFS
jgi:subtilisin family serine protease